MEKRAFLSDPDYVRAVAAEHKVVEATLQPLPEVFTWSDEQVEIYRAAPALLPGEHIFVEAGAGSGKTTTIAQTTKVLPHDKRIVVLVFNKHNVKSIKDKVPTWVSVRTDHSLGLAVCRKQWPDLVVDKEGEKVPAILNLLLNKDTHGYLFGTIMQLVSLVKNTLSFSNDDALYDLCERFGIELNGDAELVFDTVRYTLERCKADHDFVDFDDMCWLPVVYNLSGLLKYDYIFLDEAQDTNKCQIALVKLCLAEGGHLIAVGDRYQSMYGFRGADAYAVENIISEFHAKVFPLSKTYRNPECIVELVNEKFPEITFTGTGKAGSRTNLTYEQALSAYKDGDMVLCRTNAPLVHPVFELIRRGVKATIRGSDVSKGLLALVKKMKTVDIVELLAKLDEYKLKEIAKLNAANKSAQAQNLSDKVETIVALSDGVYTVYDLENRIANIFSDDVEGVVFSSIHKAKGLEAGNVYLLGPDLLPHPMAKQEWEKAQERNIEYVAYTRVLDNLIIVPRKKD